MKKIFLFNLALTITFFVNAQNIKNKNYSNKNEKAPHSFLYNNHSFSKKEALDKLNKKQNNHPKDIDALWDVQFSNNVNTGSGIETDGNHFYVSQWDMDSIYVYELNGDPYGSFLSPVSNIRDMAYDGTYFYGSNVSNVIYEMDFTNHVVIDSIVCPAYIGVRHIAYDYVNDAFWVGDWDTDIYLVDRSGQVINTIYHSVHNLNMMYGSAFDNFTSGGPYLWVFDQGGNGCNIVMIQISTGKQTGIIHDCKLDVASNIGDPSAGGLFIHQNLFSGTVTLGGIIQGEKIFGYDLSTLVAQNDIAVEKIISPLTTTNCLLSSAENVTVKLKNYGLNSASNFDLHLNYNNNNYTLHIPNTINSFDTLDISFQGTFDFSTVAVYKMTINTSYAADNNSSNDTLFYKLITGNGICTVNLLTDYYPEETSWELFTRINHEIYGYSKFSYVDTNTFYSTDLCIDTNLCYTFSIYDEYGDGISFPGYYEILLDGNQIAYSDTFQTNYAEVPYIGSCDYSDAGVIKVLSPLSSCSLSSEEHVTVRIKNFGTKAINSPEVAYSVNGTTVTEQIPDTLNSLEELDYTFVNICDLSALSQYSLKAYTIYNSDADNINDTIVYSFENYSPASLPYTISFDDPDINAQLIISDDNLDNNTWNIINGIGVSNSNCAVYSYNPNKIADDWLFTKCLDLTSNMQYVLKFYYKAVSSSYPEKLKVHLCQAPTSSAAFSDPLVDLNYIIDSTYILASVPFTVDTSGNYYIGWNVYSDANEWNLYIDNISITVPTDISENNKEYSQCYIYPNPASDQVYAEVSNFSVVNKTEIQIFNINGELLKKIQIQGNKTQIDISKFAQGVYIIKVIDKNGIVAKRIVKE